MRSSIEGIFLEGAKTRAELHKIQHKSTQVVADQGIGLENYLIRNVAAVRNFQCNDCLRKIKTLSSLSENFYQDELDPAEPKNAGSVERRAELRRSARRQQFIIKVSSWRFYNQQEEVFNQKSLRVIDRFVFNNLAVNNAGHTADNKHTGSMIFPFLLLVIKTGKPLGDDTFQNQSVKLTC